MYRTQANRRRRIPSVLAAILVAFTMLVLGVFTQQGIPALASGSSQLNGQAVSLFGPMQAPWADTSNSGPWRWGSQSVQTAMLPTAPVATTIAPNDPVGSDDGEGDDSANNDGRNNDNDRSQDGDDSNSGNSSKSTASGAPAPSGATNPKAEKAIEVALAQLGKPYVWAGDGPANFDCSGLTKFAYKAAGIEIPRHSTTQLGSFPAVPMDKLQRGDLVGRTGHVAIYLGDGKVVEAQKPDTDVMISPLDPKRFQRAARPY